MRLPSKFLLALAIALPATYGTAFAQSVGVEVYGGPTSSYADDDYGTTIIRERRPSVYGYSSEVVVPDAEVRVRRVNCGEFRYWNGERCADARVNPPDLN